MINAFRKFRMNVSLILGIALLAVSQPPSKADEGAQAQALYRNEQYRFTVNYPSDWKTTPIAPQDKHGIFRAASPNGTPNIRVGARKMNEQEILDPNNLLETIKVNYQLRHEFKILGQEDIKLNDGTPAKAFTCEWTWSDGVTLLVSSALITIKDGNSFYVMATGYSGLGNPESLLEIVKSWKFIQK